MDFGGSGVQQCVVFQCVNGTVSDVIMDMFPETGVMWLWREGR